MVDIKFFENCRKMIVKSALLRILRPNVLRPNVLAPKCPRAQMSRTKMSAPKCRRPGAFDSGHDYWAWDNPRWDTSPHHWSLSLNLIRSKPLLEPEPEPFLKPCAIIKRDYNAFDSVFFRTK